MRSVWAIGTLMALCVSAGAQTLPSKTIPLSGTDSKGCNAADTPEVADCLVSRPDTKVAFRLVWGKGDVVTQSIVLRVEVQDKNHGLLNAYEFHGRTPSLAGSVRLTPGDIADLLRAEMTSDFWDQPEKGAPAVSGSDGPDGMVTLDMCMWDGMTLAGVEAGRRLVLSRNCASDKTDPKVMAFTRTLIHVAQSHFPRLALDPKFWSGL
jgi:hypothetical protein